MPPLLALVIPCYNEEAVLSETARRLTDKFVALCEQNLISPKSNIVFIDDGSTDKTWAIIEKFHERNSELFCGIKLAKNAGHQNALLCGLLAVRGFCDAAISLDADLQHDINAIDGMIRQFNDGCHIVYGVRSDRSADTVFKKITAHGFYWFVKILGAEIIADHADYRLMSAVALDALAEYSEVNLFLRGIVPLLGYRTGIQYFQCAERFAGESKYPLRKMIKFALDGITSLSIRPIRMITFLGMALFLASIALVCWFVGEYYAGNTVSGWSSMIVSLWGIGGLVLLSIGIVGEYIGKIYLETKRRPRFRVEKTLRSRQ